MTAPFSSAPGVGLFPEDSHDEDNKWRLQVQALTIAPMELDDIPKSDAVMASLRRLQQPYLGCLLLDKPSYNGVDDSECSEAFKVIGLRREEFDLFTPFPNLSALERSLLQAEVFGEKSDGAIKKPLSIPFILDISHDVCSLRYKPPKRKVMPIEANISLPVFVQKITLVNPHKDNDSFFEIETNLYKFEQADVGSEKVVCENDLVIFSLEESGGGSAPVQAPVQSFSADSATFCLDRTYSVSSVVEHAEGVSRKTVMRIKIPDNPPACDYSLLGTVFDVDALQSVEQKYEDKLDSSSSNWAIKVHGDQPAIPSNSKHHFALFFVPPQHANDPSTKAYVQAMENDHGLQLGWLYQVRANDQSSPGFQVEPVFKTIGDPCVYLLLAQALAPSKKDELDPKYHYNLYKQLDDLQKKKPPRGHFKVVLIPHRIVLMPLYFKPDSLFVPRPGNALELQLHPEKECFAIVAGIKPGAVYHASIISQIQHVRDALIKHFRTTGHVATHDVAIDTLAVFSFCSNKITDPDACRMLLSCAEDIAAVLGCGKKSKRIKRKPGLLYTHPDQINTLWKLYGIGLTVEAFNRLAHSSKSFSHTLHHISHQEVIDLALKIHFVERVGSIFEMQQRVLLQCFDVMDVRRQPLMPGPVPTVPKPSVSSDEAYFTDPFTEKRAEKLMTFLACMKREVFEPGVNEKYSDGDQKVFRMSQNISRIIRKLLRMNPPFHKEKFHQLISEVVFMASTSLSLVSRFIKQFTAFKDFKDGPKHSLYKKRQDQWNSLLLQSPDNVEMSCCILQQCDQAAFEIQSRIGLMSVSPQSTIGSVVNNPYFLQMSITVVVAAMVDFVSPLCYWPISDRPFASDTFQLSLPADPHRNAEQNFLDRIKILQKVKNRCDRLKHINLHKTGDRSSSDVSSRRSCYYGIVDLALHACWYSMCQRGEELCKYNIPQSQERQAYLPFETYFPLQRHPDVLEYEETPKIVERWSSGLVFLNKVMLPSLSFFSDPSSKAVRVCSVSSVCNFLRTCASLDETLFKFLFFRDVVTDYRARGSKVSACHLLLEAAASCIDLEPEVSLSIHNKAVNSSEEEEVDDEENLWFPFKLMYQNFRIDEEFESHFFQTARLSSTFRLMRSLCSLSLLAAATSIQNSANPSLQEPPSIYVSEDSEEQMANWLTFLNNLPPEKCPVKHSLEDDDDEDNQYFSDPYFLICYMMICKESIQLNKIPEFQNDPRAQDEYFYNHFIKAIPHSHTLHLNSNPRLIEYFRDLKSENCPARTFSTQFFSESAFEFDNEEFKYEFTNPEFNHERMLTNWIDFLSAYVELNSKKLSCPDDDASEIDHRDKLEALVSSLEDVLSSEIQRDEEKYYHNLIFNHMRRVFEEQEQEDPDIHHRWMNMIDPRSPNARAPNKASEITKRHPLAHPHPLDLEKEIDDPQYGGLCCLGICVSFWMFPYTTTPMKASLVRYLRCYLEGVHNFHQHLIKHMPIMDVKAKNMEKVKELAAKRCRWLFCIPESQVSPVLGDPPVISAIKSDFEKMEWSHTIEILKLLRVMLIFEAEPSKYMLPIIDCLRSCFEKKSFSFLDDEGHHVMPQRFEVFTCFASILADLCESFDPADYFLSQQENGRNSMYCQFRYAVLRQVCVSASASYQNPLCCLFLNVLSYVSRHIHYVQLMPAALAALRLLLTAHERQKELGVLRARDAFICRPFEEDSLDSFEAVMISKLAVPFLFCAAGHMEIRAFPALSLYMSSFHFYPDVEISTPVKEENIYEKFCLTQSHSFRHRILLEFPRQLCSWMSSATLLSLSNSVLLLSSSMLLLSRILDDAARTIPNSSHGILLQIMPSAEIPSSHRCGPALDRVDRTLSFVVDTLLEQDGFGFFIFHSYLNGRREWNDQDDHLHTTKSLIHQWIFSNTGNALSNSPRRLSKFLSCQSMAHRNILIGDYFCRIAFGAGDDDTRPNVFGTLHPFQLQLFDQQECHDAIFQKLMDVGSERSHESVKGNFSSDANILVNFIALLQALTCVSINGVCDILRTCPPKTDSSHHAPSLAHVLLNQHAMFSHSIVDDSSFVVFDDFLPSRLLLSLLQQVKNFCTVPNETQRFENLNHRMVWLLPILSRSWEIIAILLDDPFSRLLCTHVIQIFRSSIPGESWLWGSCGELGQRDVLADSRHTSLSALVDCASFLNYFLKMNSNLNPSYPWEDDVDYKYLHALHDLLSHSIHAISWSVKALKSMLWIVTTLRPERFSYDFAGLVNIWHWSVGRPFWNRQFVSSYPSDEPQSYVEDDEDSMTGTLQQDVHLSLQNSIRHAVESRSSFAVEQQLFELTLRCQNNEFDNVATDMGHGLPDWFVFRLKNWYFFEDRMMLGDVLATRSNMAVDLLREWESFQTKASKFNVVLFAPQSQSYRWAKSARDPFKIIDRNMMEIVFRRSIQALGTLPPNHDEAFKSISLHALHFNHAVTLKSAKCHLAQSLGSLFSVIFRAHSSPQFDMVAIFKHREEVSTCVVFIDFALRMCLFLRDWLVTHLQSDFTLRFLKAARFAIFRLKDLSHSDKESFLQQNRSVFLKISENICQIIISKSSNVNQAAALERQELYMLLLEYLSVFNGNDPAYQGSDFILQQVLCCDEQRYLPLAFYTILRDVSNANTLQSIEAMMLLARLLRLVPATIAIVNVVASSSSFGTPLSDFIDGPLSQIPLFSSVFHSRCLLLCRTVQRNSSLIPSVVIAIKQSPFFTKKGSFFSVVSTPSPQNSQERTAQFADQVVAFHLVADSFMSVIFHCAFALDTVQSFSASEGLLELLHFLHVGFYQYREGDNVQIEHWLLRLLRHFSGSCDAYVEYLVRRRACLPAPFMRPFSSFITCLYGQVIAAVLSLAVLQRHRVRHWSGAVPSLAVFKIADKEIPQLLVHTALADVSLANVDILDLPRGKLSQQDLEYDHMMAIYQMRLDILLYASVYCRHLPAEFQIVNGRPFFQFLSNFDPGLFMALNNLQLSSPLHGATVPHVRHLFEICYKMTWSIKKSYDSDYPVNQVAAEWQPRADAALRNKLRSTMLSIVENLCHSVIQLLLAHTHVRSDPLVAHPESGYITIALDVVKRAQICARHCKPSACDSLHALHLELVRFKLQE